MNTKQLRRSISLEKIHSGVQATALCRDKHTPFSWYETVLLSGYYCDDEECDGCDAYDDDALRLAAYENLTARGITPLIET